jgi:hypothetical protein
LSKNLGAPGTTSNHFELQAEQLLMEISICHEEDSSHDSDDGAHTKNHSNSVNEYHDNYIKSRKLFKKMQKKTEDLRQE